MGIQSPGVVLVLASYWASSCGNVTVCCVVSLLSWHCEVFSLEQMASWCCAASLLSARNSNSPQPRACLAWQSWASEAPRQPQVWPGSRGVRRHNLGPRSLPPPGQLLQQHLCLPLPSSLTADPWVWMGWTNFSTLFLLWAALACPEPTSDQPHSLPQAMCPQLGRDSPHWALILQAEPHQHVPLPHHAHSNF